jgi:ribonucleoside-triphosphate reductase
VKNVKTIEKKIAALKDELKQVTGTPTEVYTRIVGYYRSVKNWNKGKREEYSVRREYSPDSVPSTPEGAAEPHPALSVQ